MNYGVDAKPGLSEKPGLALAKLHHDYFASDFAFVGSFFMIVAFWM